MREDSWLRVTLNNLPYILMLLFGSWLLVAGLQPSVWSWVAGTAYLVYGIFGTFWIMVFMCPHCALHGSWKCPCYGRLSALLVNKAPVPAFHENFMKHIPVIVPLWFIPPIIGIVILIKHFSWGLLIVLGLFSLVGFVILPLASRGYSCRQCPQHNDCPWMKHRR